MNQPAPAQSKSALFWIFVALGVSAAGCCFVSLAVFGLGVFAGAEEALGDSPPPGAASPSRGGDWKPAGKRERGTTLTQPLPGGRWLMQFGSSVDNVVARSGNTAWVQTNSSGTLYEFTFDEDGSYVFVWVDTVTLNGNRGTSQCTEKGSWSLDGTQLTLTPESQVARYSNNNGTQDKEHEDFEPRVYQVVDITLETLTAAGATPERFSGVELRGPGPKWDFGRSQYEFDLQRL